jgi:enterochelin esterase-like enzyme
MRYRFALVLVLLVGGTLERPAKAQCTNLPPGTANVSFQSMYMGGAWPLVVYLPPGYATSTRQYPVVYWFHGRGDNQCTQLPLATNIQAAIQSGAATPMIYVFLNGGAQCNFDDTSCPGNKTESYVMKELIPYIDGHYRTIPKPEAKALEGFSMGAEAVLRYFYTYTDQFCDVMAYAPLARGTVPQPAQDAIKARGEVVMRIAVGTADAVHFMPCQTYDRMLTSLMIPHEYEEVPGVVHNPFALWGAMNGMVGQRGLALHTRCFAHALADSDAGSAADAGMPNDAGDEDGQAVDGGAVLPVDSGESEASPEEAGAPEPTEPKDGATREVGDDAFDGGTTGAAPSEDAASHSGCACTTVARRESRQPTGAVLGVAWAALLAARRGRRAARSAA